MVYFSKKCVKGSKMTDIRENKMGTMPIGKLIFTMSVPMVASMLVQAFYNVIDSIFVARFSDAAMSAVTYAFPAQNLMIGLATGTGVGVNALLSRSLGEKDSAKANRVAENGVFLALLGYLIFLIFGLFGAEAFIRFQTDTPQVIAEGAAYLSVCCVFSFGIFGEIMFERLMQATGRTVYTMFTQGLGAIINIILDPIFIFGYFGVPAMGAKGAAIATVIGQIASFLLAIVLNQIFNKDIRLKLLKFRPSGKIISNIYSIGFPSVIMMGIGSVMNTGMNKILGGFTEIAVNVFGAYFKLQSFAFMPIFGINNGVIPIIAYNYGAKKRKRLLKAIRLSVTTIIFIMIGALVLMQVIPHLMLALFDASDEMLFIGIPALKTISLSYIFAGVCIGLTSVFQALGKGIYATIMSFVRQLVVLLPAAYLLSLTGELNLVWWSYPIAEVMSVTVCLVLFLRLYKQVIKPLPLENASV